MDLDHLQAAATDHWGDYGVGVAKVLALSGISLCGASLLVDGDVPQGAGLSSSASLEVVIGFALLELANQKIDRAGRLELCTTSFGQYRNRKMWQ